MGEKLVRDKIPEIIREKGDVPKVRIASDEELDAFLRAKLVEEATELLASGDFEEIVDIIEVLDRLIVLRKTDRAMLELQRETKKHFRGGFEHGYILTMESDD
ncbi:hypothetical protein EU527_12050 [Candidatus Thorarchaeota archaeon]|nr:MAG: hypothetical protein EU527_12050 [Candidatus Thorarchaeota archaeon]